MTPQVQRKPRLHYLDWLQVLAIFGVFLFHSVHPFDALPAWHIENAEESALATFFGGFFSLWGMPFFFFMAGATSWFSLKRRSPSQYVRERVSRLLVPFIVGAIVLTPIQAYFELRHAGWWDDGSFLDFVLSNEARSFFYRELNPFLLSPETFSNVGYHLWFVGFLFMFSLIALPLFLWFNGDRGTRLVSALARLAERRGGLLVFAIPPLLSRLVLHPFFPEYTGWSDFTFTLFFFIIGYVAISDERFSRAIQRDRLLHLIIGLISTSFFFSVATGVPVYQWLASPGTLGYYVSHILWSFNSWCWTMVMFYVGMRYLNRSSVWLTRSREASFVFFFLHQPVIMIIAFYVVQWDTGITPKLLTVVFGSVVILIGLIELLVKRVRWLRVLFGLKLRTG